MGDVEGGLLAWLYGETDLDDVLLALLRGYEQEHDEASVAISYHPTIGPALDMPQGDPSKEAEFDQDAWNAYFKHLPPYVGSIDEDIPTSFGDATVDVGWFRRMPWCNCGEGHSWHYENAAGPGRGASLAVLVSWYC